MQEILTGIAGELSTSTVLVFGYAAIVAVLILVAAWHETHDQVGR